MDLLNSKQISHHLAAKPVPAVMGMYTAYPYLWLSAIILAVIHVPVVLGMYTAYAYLQGSDIFLAETPLPVGDEGFLVVLGC